MGIKHLSPKSREELKSSVANLSAGEMVKFGCQEGILWLVEEGIKKGYKPESQDNAALLWASQIGSASIVSYLLTFPKVNPTALGSVALRAAVYYGHYEVVKILLEDGRADPADYDGEIVRDLATFEYDKTNRFGGVTPAKKVVGLLMNDSRFMKAYNAYIKDKYIK